MRSQFGTLISLYRSSQARRLSDGAGNSAKFGNAIDKLASRTVRWAGRTALLRDSFSGLFLALGLAAH